MRKGLEKLFRLLVINELFDGVEKVVLVGGDEVKIHKTPDGGITIYSEFAEKQIALSVYQYGTKMAMSFRIDDGTNRLRLAETVMKALLRKLIAGELGPREIQKGEGVYSSEIERMFKQADANGLFKTGYPVLAIVRDYCVLIKASSFEGIEIYTDYPNGKIFAVMQDGGTLEGFGKGFTALDLKRVMEVLADKQALDNLVLDHINGPGVPLSIGRFREICKQARIKPIGQFGFHMGAIGYMPEKRPKTLDQWFKQREVKNG